MQLLGAETRYRLKSEKRAHQTHPKADKELLFAARHHAAVV